LLAARQADVRVNDVRAGFFAFARNQWIGIRREHRRFRADDMALETMTAAVDNVRRATAKVRKRFLDKPP